MTGAYAAQERSRQETTHDDTVVPSGPRAWPAWAGIVGPLLFTATYMMQEAFRRDEYSAIAEPVSALEAGPHGWVQEANFVVFGMLTLAFAVGLNRGIRPSRAGLAGPALFFASGIGLLLAAILPLKEDASGTTYDPGGHFVAGVVFFLSSAAGLVVLSRRLRGDPAWRNIAGFTLGAGLLGMAGFFTLGVLAIPDGAPLHEWAGLAQRFVLLAVLFPARILLSVRLLQIEHARS